MPISGVGTVFSRKASGGSYEPIASIKSIAGPTKTRGTIDTTALDTVGGYRTFIAGFRDGGQVTLNMLFERDGYELMNADFEDEDEVDYKITLPDDDQTSISFSGLVTELPLNIPTDDAVTADVTIKVSGVTSMESGSGS